MFGLDFSVANPPNCTYHFQSLLSCIFIDAWPENLIEASLLQLSRWVAVSLDQLVKLDLDLFCQLDTVCVVLSEVELTQIIPELN